MTYLTNAVILPNRVAKERKGVMHMKRRILMQMAAVLVFSMGLTTVALGADKSVPLQEKEYKLSAGVSAAINSEDIKILSLNAGVASTLTDFYSVSVKVEDQGANVVAQGQDSAVLGQSQIGETTICGYTNIGIADVNGNLNVRKEASASGKIVGKMTQYAACEILGTEGEWTKISSGEVEGYVKSEFLLTGSVAEEIAKKQLTTVAKVETSNLRVRKEANTESAVISQVSEGEELTLLEDLDGWYKVEVDNEEGYISADYASVYDTLKTAQTLEELRYGSGVSETRVDMVSYALQFVGNRYVWGGTSLTNGVDCSGFTMKIYQRYGISLPHSSKAQPSYGTKIKASEAQPGDLFFYGSGKSINHVGIYIGNGQIVHASGRKTGIKISNAFYRKPICVVSYFE